MSFKATQADLGKIHKNMASPLYAASHLLVVIYTSFDFLVYIG